MRAHGGFVKKISGTDTDDDFKAYILPSVSKIDFIRTNVINTNSNEEVAVTGSQDKLKFKLENKIVVYELCKGSIVDVDNETPDNDKMIETSREISAIMSNENEENKEETVVPEVTTTEEVEEPVAVPEEEEPVAVPEGEEEQVVVPEEEEPLAVPEGEEPVAAPAEEEQVVAPAEEEPAVVPEEEEQVTVSEAEEPVAVPVAEEPVAVPVAEEPVAVSEEEAKENNRKMSFVDNALKSINDKLTSFSTNILSKKTETPEIISITPGSTVLPKPQEVDINTEVKSEIEQIGEATEEQEPTLETEAPVTTQEPTLETESPVPTPVSNTETVTPVPTPVSNTEVNKPPNSSGPSGSLLVGGKSRKRRLIRGSNSRKVKTI
jgi:hypothetical protein